MPATSITEKVAAPPAANVVTWSVEERGGKCPFCKGETVTVLAPVWIPDQEAVKLYRAKTGDEDSALDEIELGEEISGGYCPRCERLTSLCAHL